MKNEPKRTQEMFQGGIGRCDPQEWGACRERVGMRAGKSGDIKGGGVAVPCFDLSDDRPQA